MRKLYLRLVVVLDAHGEDVDADDEGDEEVQVVARAERVDGQTQGGVVGIVGPLLGLWGAQTKGGTRILKRTDQEKAAASGGVHREREGQRRGSPAIFFFFPSG